MSPRKPPTQKPAAEPPATAPSAASKPAAPAPAPQEPAAVRDPIAEATAPAGGERAPDRRTLIADTAIGLVASGGLRGLTHRAVDGAAGLPAGSTSYYFRTRTALIAACYRRLAELDVADGPLELTADRDAAARAFGALLYHWLTAGRERQLARFELSLEAARNPELEPGLREAGLAVRARGAAVLAALGAREPQESAELLAAWADGLLYDRLAGALARSRPAPDPAELVATARRMIDAVLEATV
ncbi:TetR/AcrR family transcriptional regulator [Streptomyces sp. NPDC048387]|uniref:TetR/AcrR family transcriptional regulator n=1 Tax=Streptomyces sp. NPDC048387 TaxID=3365542 RepID=UPI003719747D